MHPLQSAIHHALIKSKERIIQSDHLPLELKKQKVNQSSPGPFPKLDYKSVKDTLIRSGGNKAKASRLLGVGRATLYRFLTDSPDVSSSIYESD
ncbi:MAG: hypothetical protein SRB2_03262 [Desulfobacteraceae bacterium Eth-SRB2]|nr:MAG: hypothetical protein SRB2_03262 [Desulfobacteraceae bacterium Eth-SRB2]